jgi:tetratricopeptide (TPR) repeat protein
VFAGGWTLEATEAVCAADGIEGWEVLDLLTQLVEKSLVLYGEEEGQARYRVLETIRQYARDRLLESGEAEAVRERHRDWYLKFAEAWPRPGWERLEVEHDNLRAALVWSRVQKQAEAGLRLGEALRQFWTRRGYGGEGREHLAGLLALPEAEARTPVRARALGAAGWLGYYQGDPAAAQALHEESLAIFRELEDKPGIAGSLSSLGWVAWYQGDYGAAQALYEESLAIFRDLGVKWGVAWSVGNLGWVACEQGEYGVARALFEERLAICREQGDEHGIAESLWYLGMTAHGQGDCVAARALLEEGLAMFRDLGTKQEIAESLEALAAVAVAQAQPERAARLFGATAGLCDAMGAPLPPVTRAERDRSVAAARTALDEEGFAAAWAEGRAMTLDAAVTFALEEVPDA